LPDIHSGYGFAIGNIAAFDVSNPDSVVSPGGVGFDINCGVRLLRTNLSEKDVQPHKEQLAQALFDHIPVGVGSRGIIPIKVRDFEECLEMGMDWTLREGYSWAEDKEHCEEYGRMLSADASKVSVKAKKRGLPQACFNCLHLIYSMFSSELLVQEITMVKYRLWMKFTTNMRPVNWELITWDKFALCCIVAVEDWDIKWLRMLWYQWRRRCHVTKSM
jgi:hypothetical protein